jgi:hypothetical protein
MVAIPSKHKSLSLLAVVLIAQLLLLAVQIKRDSHGRLIRVWAITAVSPFDAPAPGVSIEFAACGATISRCRALRAKMKRCAWKMTR